jgi:hypothetical protein
MENLITNINNFSVEVQSCTSTEAKLTNTHMQIWELVQRDIAQAIMLLGQYIPADYYAGVRFSLRTELGYYRVAYGVVKYLPDSVEWFSTEENKRGDRKFPQGISPLGLSQVVADLLPLLKAKESKDSLELKKSIDFLSKLQALT